MEVEQSSSGSPTQATKQCWGCVSITEYDIGLCPGCWALLPIDVKEIYNASFRCPPSIGGAIRLSISRYLQDLRRPKAAPYVPRPKLEKVKRALPPINLSLEDLEL